MATWCVKGILPEFHFHAKNSMAALNKIRKWCKNNNKEYGKDVNIIRHHEDDMQTEKIHNEYFE